MFRKHSSHKRSSFLPFVIFRLILSLIIFTVMLGGLYSAFQYFSGVDILKVNPKALTESIITASQDPKTIVNLVTNLDLKGLLEQGEPVTVPQTSQGSWGSESFEGKTPLFSFIIVGDSHTENNYLQRALTQGKVEAENLQFVIGVGDYTEIGTDAQLRETKKEFDNAGLRYFLVPGDHDLWDSRDKKQDPITNFRSIFGVTYQSFVYQNVKFILINNADNYIGILDSQMDWISKELAKARLEENVTATFVFMHEPLYHPSSDHVMGRVTPGLKNQAKELLSLLKSGEVREIFYGDTHFSTRYQDPETELKMTTVGAVASARNTQVPRFAVVTVYDDGSYRVEDVEIK